MKTGDARFVEIYERFYHDIYGYCRRRTDTQDVDDAVADTFLTCWRKIDDVPAGDEALLWLFSVARRAVGHQWRSSARSKRLRERLMSVGADMAAPPEDFLIRRSDSDLVLKAVSRLSRAHQEVLALALWEELPGEDVATVLGVSPGAARQRLYRARRSLTREYNRLEKRLDVAVAAPQGEVL